LVVLVATSKATVETKVTEAGTPEGVWERDATAEAHPEYPPRPDAEALTDEQKAHLKEYGLL
jgi:hypothetical protein